MDIVRVRELSDAELGNELVTQRRHLYDLRFQLATRQLTDHSQLTLTRRSIARLLTVMTERGLDENAVARQATIEPAKPAGRVRGRGRSTAAKSAPKSKESTKKSTSGGNNE
jgi:large subunit ribosomal protein L29